MHKFHTPAPISAVLNIPAGRVQIIAADRTDTTVEIRPANPTKNRDTKTAEQTEITYTDGILHIHTPEPDHQLLGHPGSVEITIQLPAGSHIEAKTAATELRGVGRLGDITFDGAYRHTKIDEATGVRITATDSDIEIGRLTGPAQITTARGTIRITEAVTGTLDLRTESGDITVGAATGTSATLDASTGYGRINNTLKNDGTPALDIRATTSHGDITAHSL
ncbi:DUF4097 family beta strand repeat-containing protein [Streptomyces sp. Tu102]|uniref:DUF4097 family beta strand repeat-containing protein n=1 Tax=Streptomyces TaxID=1883 RepID=UPI001BDD1EB6|nr:DUF4097 family beta strand repeat-containing protein [Streptomyces sp. Tu102]MBT1094219.1 DUF4097 family beta strand repeat protein [Streptomyces sp. Tu102]